MFAMILSLVPISKSASMSLLPVNPPTMHQVLSFTPLPLVDDVPDECTTWDYVTDGAYRRDEAVGIAIVSFLGLWVR